MAREIILNHQGADSRFAFAKLTRAKLYGRKRRVQLDNAGEPTKRASIACNGAVIVQSGMTGQGYFDEAGVQHSRSALVGLAPDGTELPLHKSTLNNSQPLREASPSALFDTTINAIYALTAEDISPELQGALEAGQIFHFDFNYGADYLMEHGFLVQNQHGIFALIGQPTSSEWIGQDPIAVPVIEEDDDDDLDFEMF